MFGESDPVTVLLGGDVMLGRGVDQALPHPGEPELRERYVTDARMYVELAVQENGPIPRPMPFDRLWGDVLTVPHDLATDVGLVNLETAITADGEFADRKGIHYRMHPGNLAALTAFGPDCCALANNHILDFGHRGLTDTIEALAAAGIAGVGAGANSAAARRPAMLTVGDECRVVVVSVASMSSGVPASWAADRDRPGLWLIDESARSAADDVAEQVSAHRGDRDIAVVSVHWGSNWGYGIGLSEIQFAHRLIDAGVDIVHGHSSHHPRPIEIYRGKPILYGCGDVIDDYEGIHGHESYRNDLRLLYFASIHPGSGELAALRMLPLRLRRMRLERAAPVDGEWLRAMIERISRGFGTRVTWGLDDLLVVRGG